jgi:tetrahydromethanopterin S-methyltransferase subunit A
VLLDRIGLTDPDEIMRIVRKYKYRGEAYQDEPVVTVSQKKRQTTFSVLLSGDIIISEELVMDAASGIICEAKDF